VRQFLPLPSEPTIHTFFREHKDESTNLPEHSILSVAVDAIAMNPDHSYLPTREAEYAFVIFVQPFDRRYRCFPLHVKQHESGAATPDVRAAVTSVCDALFSHGLIVKYQCADGDKGHNAAHADFFNQWYSMWENQGLAVALRFVSETNGIPVGDFLHLWKNYCNKVKNHPVVVCPDSLANMVPCDALQALLGLGRVLTDETPTGKMRDADALKLFTLANCTKCLEHHDLTALMYLMPWTLQEVVIRSPLLSRQERLEKAILSLKLLLHYYYLSHFPYAEGVSQRFHSGRPEAVTFAKESDWPRILNSAVALIEFILAADEH
jgi:hypothetical protein